MLDISYRAAPAVPAQASERAHSFSGLLQSRRVRQYLLHALIVAVSSAAATTVAIG